ncbi:MAG: ABC transporter permease [Actinobacteria bacterium]|nr:MAG: ABC transporter permease [Actinomycetota bacterium]
MDEGRIVAEGAPADLVPSPRHAAAVWYRNASVFSKLWRGALLPTFLDPFFYLLALGFGLGTYVAQVNGIPYKDFVAPGLIASAAMWSAAFETTYNVYFRMNELRLYDNVLSTPVEVQDLVAGDLAWSATRATLYGTVVLVVVAALGLVSSPWAILIPPFVALGGLYSYFFTLGITPMFLFSGIFFPFDRLPGWVEAVAWLTPLYHLVEITRGMANGPDGVQILIHTAWLAAVSAALFTIPVRALRAKLVP